MDLIAIETLRAAARDGDVQALGALGKRLLLGLGTAAAPQEGHACLMDAAARGDGEASAQLALLAGWGVLRPQNWPEALEHLQRAAQMLATNSLVQDHYADVLFRVGRYDDAIAAWAKALSGDLDSVDRGDIDKKIRGAKQKLPKK